MKPVTTESRSIVFGLYSSSITQNEIIRTTKLPPDYVENLIQGWEIDKAREKLRIKHENKIDAKPRILIDKPKESNFILCTEDMAVLAAYNKLINP